MTHDPGKDPSPDTAEAEPEFPATDPAHRAALVAMVASPVVLGAAVYLLLRLLNG